MINMTKRRECKILSRHCRVSSTAQRMLKFCCGSQAHSRPGKSICKKKINAGVFVEGENPAPDARSIPALASPAAPAEGLAWRGNSFHGALYALA